MSHWLQNTSSNVMGKAWSISYTSSLLQPSLPILSVALDQAIQSHTLHSSGLLFTRSHLCFLHKLLSLPGVSLVPSPGLYIRHKGLYKANRTPCFFHSRTYHQIVATVYLQVCFFPLSPFSQITGQVILCSHFQHKT